MSPTERPHRRRTDRPWLDRVHAAWRSDAAQAVMTFIALALAAWAVWTSQNTATDAKQSANNAQQIARVARQVARGNRQRLAQGRLIRQALCGAVNGVEAAGRASITAPILPVRFRVSLERLGLPPEKVRRIGAERAAVAYARSISRAVAVQAGPTVADQVIQKDGTLDCSALSKVGR